METSWQLHTSLWLLYRDHHIVNESALLYLEDSSEGLPGQLVVNGGEEFAERPQEGGGLHTLPQQVLDGGQDVNHRLLKQTNTKKRFP